MLYPLKSIGLAVLWLITGCGTAAGLPQSHAAAAYDSTHHRLCVVGGARVHGLTLGSVYVLDLNKATKTWREVHISGDAPSWREDASLVYDPAHDDFLLFGGLTSGEYDRDLWSLHLSDTPRWERLLPGGEAPSPRCRHTVTYDPTRNVMWLYGGQTKDMPHDVQSDLWMLSLDPAPRWQRMAPAGDSPGPRMWHTAVWYPDHASLAVFGGLGEGHGPTDADLWELLPSDTLHWERWHPADLDACGIVAAYDPVRRGIVLFGGVSLLGGVSTYLKDDVFIHLDRRYGHSPSRVGKLGYYESAAGRGSPVTPPPARAWGIAVYDRIDTGLVVISGQTSKDARVPTCTWGPGDPVLNDAWLLADNASSPSDLWRPLAIEDAPEEPRTALSMGASAPSASPPPLRASAFAHLMPAHAAVVKAWLSRRPELRPLLRRDVPPELEPTLVKRGITTHPYYVVGDFNRDGIQDFAVEFLDMRDSARTASVVAIFNGPFTAGKRPAPAFVSKPGASPANYDRGWVMLSAAANRRDWTPAAYMRSPRISNLAEAEEGLGTQVWFISHGRGYAEGTEQD